MVAVQICTPICNGGVCSPCLEWEDLWNGSRATRKASKDILLKSWVSDYRIVSRGRERDEKVCRKPTRISGMSDLCVSGECLLTLGPELKQQMGRQFRKGRYVGSLGIGNLVG